MMIFVLEVQANEDECPCWRYQGAFSSEALAKACAREHYDDLDDDQIRIYTDYVDSEKWIREWG